MQYFKTIRRLTLDDLSEIFNAIARFPYFGGFLSLLSALYDFYEILSSLFNKKLLEKKLVLKTALGRLCGHVLIGLGGLVPLISFAAFMVFNPTIIPLVALGIATAELYKFYKITKAAITLVSHRETCFREKPTQNNFDELKEAREAYYQAKQELVINLGLFVGAVLGVIGLIFPPLLLAGICVSLGSAGLGLIDKKYRFSERMSYFIFGNPDTHDEQILKQTIVAMQPLKKPLPMQLPASKKIVNYANPPIDKQPSRFFYTEPHALSVAPSLVAMRNYR